MSDRVAYILNQYPKVSHSFIRTEILALERRGARVDRIAMRGWDAEVVDPLDRLEREHTRYVLRGGALPLLGAAARILLAHPRRFVDATLAAMRLARGGERGLLIHLIYLAEACVIARWLQGTDASHCHAHFGSNAAAVALLVRRLGGPPYSFTVHGPEEFDKPLQLKLREKIRDAASVVAITSFCRSQLFRWADPADWTKIAVVGCALDDRFLAVETSREMASPRPPELVCVGRLCEQKGQLLLIEAIAGLRRRGHDVRLTLAGDGEMRALIEAAISRASLQDVVTITGWIDAATVRALLSRSLALVLPSFAEGLPIVIMEAMALGRPVISTMIAGIPELVRDGREGWLTIAGDVEGLIDALERIVTASPSDLAAMGASGAVRVRERHISDRQAERLARLFGAASNSDDQVAAPIG